MKLWKGGIEALIYQPLRSSKADGAETNSENWQLYISYHQNQTNIFECCDLRRKNAASFANVNTHKSWFTPVSLFYYSLFYFFVQNGVFPMMIYLLTGQWSSTGQLIIFQYPSMVDEKNNGLTQRSEQSSKYSESHLATPCISVSFLVQKVMGGGRLIGAHQPSPRTLLVIKFGEFT